MTKPFETSRPKTSLPLIFDSPHSGNTYPDDFDYACDFTELKKAEDTFVDTLFSSASDHGGTLLCAHFARSYIDVNRAEDDIDPNLIYEAWPLGKINPSARSDAGIGLIRRLVKPGMPVYNRYLGVEEIISRIEKYYRPYHAELQKLMDEAHYNFGQVWHINCHSMPSASARPKQAIGLVGGLAKESDFVLGDRDGTSCDIDFTHALRDFLRSLGHTVTVNDPFKGVELVDRYSQPSRGRHSIQIEINKSLYMDEETHRKSANFDALKRDVEKLVKFCADYVSSQLTSIAAD